MNRKFRIAAIIISILLILGMVLPYIYYSIS